MEIKVFSPSEQVDPAVDLGVVLPPLPDILTMDDLVDLQPAAPPIIIDGLLHQGCKMILGGTSKSNKSWSLLGLAASVASGQPWWGRNCVKMPVLYINFELHTWAIAQRLNSMCVARPDFKGNQMGKNLHIWNLRGRNTDITLLRPKLEEQLAKYQFGLIILDPAYKVLGNRDENANGEIASLMNEFEALAQKTGAAIVLAHHFAKGDSTSKSAMDRMSGAGAWARDPDTIMVLTPHEEPDCFTVTSILRNLPQLGEFVVRWDYPQMVVATDLNPEALRRPQAKNKVCTDKEFMDQIVSKDGKNYTQIVQDAKSDKNMSESTVNNYLNRLMGNKLIQKVGKMYWPNSKTPTSL